jgi:tryptophan halogenase
VAGTFKLSISFENWRRPGERYIHPFGITGQGTWATAFHHFWLDSVRRGMPSELGDFCLETVASRGDRFSLQTKPQVNYAYHFDASLYAKFLRRIAERHGLRRLEGKIREVRQHAHDGSVSALVLEDGTVLEGDLFIDCTGFRGLLIEQTLGAGYEDWRHWLPTDSALAVQTPLSGDAPPYTRSSARSSGWQWRIPLQHRVGNGLVFCSQYQREEQARSELLQHLDGEPLSEPRLIRYITGRRRKTWDRNVVAIGLSSGFLEPLESTSIHLIQIGAMRLVQLFPFEGNFTALAARYNQQMCDDFEHVRDFIILHYTLTRRDDTPFWRACRDMEIPASLVERIELFRDSGYIRPGADELFRTASWLFVMLGQGIMPRHHHHMGAMLGDERLRRALESLRQNIAGAVQQMPSHQAFIERYCRAEPPVA